MLERFNAIRVHVIRVTDVAADNVEGGIYISPEFQLGQVYDGTLENEEDIVLYRPVYVGVPHERLNVTNMNNAHGSTSSPIRVTPHTPGKELTSEKCTSI